MKKLIYIFLIFCSCGSISEENIKPNNLIPEDKMIDILYDMSLISVSKGINKRILENNGMKPKKYILKKYNIDSLQFVVSNEYYSKDLEIYLSIYEEVLNKLQLNRELIIDSIENYKKDRAKRSQEINLESPKNNKLTKPKLSSNLNSNILEN
tara:strand:+ start:1632 stop:2090 length:459 start_codon:yes stop_codon:yes gene_type:complete